MVYDHAGVTRVAQDTRHLRSLAVWEQRASGDKSLPDAVRKALKTPAEKRQAQQQQAIVDHYIEHVLADTRQTFEPLHGKLARARAELNKTRQAVPFQLVSVEMNEPRPAFLLQRGEFDKPGDPVERQVPAFLPPLPSEAPRNRLGLAQWTVSDEHPLTARVTVNRYWAQLFGGGIVETIGDFGQLGRFPSHPQMLDWLALEFVESGWDTKHILKTMIMSATYRQSSANDGRHQAPRPGQPPAVAGTSVPHAGRRDPRLGAADRGTAEPEDRRPAGVSRSSRTSTTKARRAAGAGI